MVDQQTCQVLEVMPDPLVLMREDGRIAFANSQAGKLLGYTRDELIGLPLELLIPDRLRNRHAEHLEAYLAGPVVRPMGGRLDLWALSKDGREVAVDISLSPVETAGGLLVAVSIRDISARKKTELELRTAVAELERLRDRLNVENVYLRDEVHNGFGEFVGKSDMLKRLLENIDRVATTDTNVLILGETGTGKELVARAIHQNSGRKERPLVKVNCATLPSGLIESALFGHEKGSFTGASTQEIGRFELADSGTILLDEIGDLDMGLQTRLLRVLQEGEFERVGSSTTRKVDVRVIAATNRDLHAAMQRGRFRPDLYFRLAVFPVEVPSLRARREDIPLLVRHFVSKKQARLGKRIDEIPQTTMDRLTEYAWPGNVREMENIVERAMILSPGSTLVLDQPLDMVDMPDGALHAESASVENVLRVHMISVLRECHWRIKGAGAAADRLGMNPSTLRSRMKKLGIQRPD